MTAKEYLEAVKKISVQIAILSEECREKREQIYNITGVDPACEKVCCNTIHDLSDRLVIKEQFLTLEKRIDKLSEIQENCRLLIYGMECDDKDFLKDSQSILHGWYLLDTSKKNVSRMLKISHTQNAYRILNPAIALFEQNYNKWLQSMKEIS